MTNWTLDDLGEGNKIRFDGLVNSFTLGARSGAGILFLRNEPLGKTFVAAVGAISPHEPLCVAVEAEHDPDGYKASFKLEGITSGTTQEDIAKRIAEAIAQDIVFKEHREFVAKSRELYGSPPAVQNIPRPPGLD